MALYIIYHIISNNDELVFNVVYLTSTISTDKIKVIENYKCSKLGLKKYHWWSLDDGDGLKNLLLIDLGTWTVSLTNDVGHTSLVAQEASQVDGLGGVVLGESLHLTTVTRSALLGVEPHGPVTGCRKLTMRLKSNSKSTSDNRSSSNIFKTSKHCTYYHNYERNLKIRQKSYHDKSSSFNT